MQFKFFLKIILENKVTNSIDDAIWKYIKLKLKRINSM